MSDERREKDGTKQREYQLFEGEDRAYSVHRPIGRRVKAVARLDLRAPFSTQEDKLETAEMFGFDPLDVVPGYEEKRDGETVTSEAEPITLDHYFGELAEIIFIDVEVNGRLEELDHGRVMEGKNDFLREWGAMSALLSGF